ncbi:MAG: CPBP family intramembrane glutamic endopeptidase [Myxococcota bacterium]
MNLDRTRILDWGLTLLAVAVAAFFLGRGSGPTPDGSRATIDEVRTLEQDAKLLDAQEALPPEIRRAVGLLGDPDQDEERILRELGRTLDHAGSSPRLLLISAALAVAHGADETALEALDLLAENPEALERRRVLVDHLHALARGEPAEAPAVLRSELAVLGASPWLVHRVLARHHDNAGQDDRAESEGQAAREDATVFVERFTGLLVAVLTLGILGLLVLLLWPLVRRALFGAGLIGLEGTLSPFVVASTHRVMVVWFLGWIVVGIGISGLAAALGDGAHAPALNATAQTLIHGGIALALIQHFGRRPEDRAPLSVPLRLGLDPSPSGLLGLVMWALGGLAVCLVVVFGATVISSLLGGQPSETQPVVELFASREDLESRLLLGASVVLFAPVFEEILFRGFLYRNLRDLLGPTTAMLASGFLFAVVHFEVALLLPLGALGAALAFLYERSGSLLVPIAVHALWNGGQLVFVLVIVSG